MPPCRTCNVGRHGVYPILSRDKGTLTGMLRCEHCMTDRKCNSSFKWSEGTRKREIVVMCNCAAQSLKKQRDEEAARAMDVEAQKRREADEKAQQEHEQVLAEREATLALTTSLDDVTKLANVMATLNTFAGQIYCSEFATNFLNGVLVAHFKTVVGEFRYTVLSANPALNAVYEWIVCQIYKIQNKRTNWCGRERLNVEFPRCDIVSDPNAVWRRHDMQSPGIIVNPLQWRTNVADYVRVFEEQCRMLG
jgi:hypothetical protein